MSYTVWLNDKTKFKDLGSGQTPPYGQQTGQGVQPKFSIKKVDVLATAPNNHIFNRPTLTMWVVVAIVGQTVCLSTRQLV